MARVKVQRRSTAEAVRNSARYAVIIRTNNRTVTTYDRGGLVEFVVRTEYYATEAEAFAQVEAYEQGRTRINATEAELQGFYPWNDDNGYGDYYVYRCHIHQCASYPHAPEGMIFGFAVKVGMEIHEYGR